METEEQARNAVSYTRYPPRGVRGYSAAPRASYFRRIKDYPKICESELCVLVQVETRLGLENLEAIAGVKGVDGVFIGPGDLFRVARACRQRQTSGSPRDGGERHRTHKKRAASRPGFLQGTSSWYITISSSGACLPPSARIKPCLHADQKNWRRGSCDGEMLVAPTASPAASDDGIIRNGGSTTWDGDNPLTGLKRGYIPCAQSLACA